VTLGAALIAGCASTAALAPAAGSGPGSPRASAPEAGSPSAASASRGTGSGALCRDVATVTSLEITRAPTFRVPGLRTGYPFQVPVTSPPRARAVARALCGLPVLPPGILHCPAMFVGTTYLLRFTVDGRLLPAVTIEATGCRTVTGVGPVRRATAPGFWRVLTEAIGRRLPGPPVLGGDYPWWPCGPPTPDQMIKIDGCPALARPGAGVAEPAGAAAS